MQLHNLEEISGKLEKVEIHKNQGIVTLTFTFTQKIDLPIDMCDKDILISSLGKKISILRLDDDVKIKNDKVWDILLKTIGCKIPAELYQIIKDEISKMGKTNSEFLRMLINNYFKDRRLDEKNQVNRSETQVNHSFYTDECLKY